MDIPIAYPVAEQDIVDLFKRHDVFPTQQRVKIARALFARPQHLTADQILDLVNEDEHLVSKATVYNTLRLLAEKGLVREVLVDPARVVYDSNLAPHHHLYHLDSGEITDVVIGDPAAPALPDMVPVLGSELEVVDVDIIVRVRRRDTPKHRF